MDYRALQAACGGDHIFILTVFSKKGNLFAAVFFHSRCFRPQYQLKVLLPDLLTTLGHIVFLLQAKPMTLVKPAGRL
jgi:hypothetical protein